MIITIFKNLHEKLLQDIEFIIMRSIIYYNLKKIKKSIFKKKDAVYLL